MQKLNKLGVNLGTQAVFPKRIFVRSIDQVMEGELISNSKGDIFVYTKYLPLPFKTGDTSIESQVDTTLISKWAGLQAVKINKIAFLDTETSGLSAGTGTFMFLFGFCNIMDSFLQIKQIFLLDPSSESPFLEKIREELVPFDTFVSYNGKTFDIPILKSRATLNRIPDFSNSKNHIDLLHLARKLWKLRLPDRSLKQIETNILKFKRSEEEIPGYLIPEYYVNYLHSGDASPLKGVFYHNQIDVISLAALFNFLSRFIANPFNNSFPEALDIFSLALLYKNWGDYDLSLELFEECINLGIDKTSLSKALFNIAHIYKKKNDYINAISFWEESTELDRYDSFIELSKLYEHNLKDYQKALFWTNKLIAKLSMSVNTGASQYSLNELLKRKNRLEMKIPD